MPADDAADESCRLLTGVCAWSFIPLARAAGVLRLESCWLENLFILSIHMEMLGKRSASMGTQQPSMARSTSTSALVGLSSVQMKKGVKSWKTASGDGGVEGGVLKQSPSPSNCDLGLAGGDSSRNSLSCRHNSVRGLAYKMRNLP